MISLTVYPNKCLPFQLIQVEVHLASQDSAEVLNLGFLNSQIGALSN